METKYDNTNKISLWEKSSKKNGLIYYSGIVQMSDKKIYDIVLFENEKRTNDTQPIYRGTIKEKEEYEEK